MAQQQQPPQQIPKGFRWSKTQNRLIPIIESPVFMSCKAGYHKDPVTLECVPDLPSPTVPTLPPQTNTNPKVVKIAMGGDSKAGDTFDSLLAAIVKENVDWFNFLGDTSYIDDDAAPWIQLIDKHKLKEKTGFYLGNHEDEEEDAGKAGEQIAKWNPSWAKNNWCNSYIIGNVYLINMNSQDLDYQYAGKAQYLWVKGELEKAVALRNEGKIDWIFVGTHKPIYTMKTKHAPELKARDIYQPLFDKAQVDFYSAGHNHDFQLMWPMMYNDLQKFTFMPDGKTLDFSKLHGQIIHINGLMGRGFTPIKENWKANKNMMFAQWAEFVYSMFFIKGRQLTLQVKNAAGKVLFQLQVDKTGLAAPTPQQPQVEVVKPPKILLPPTPATPTTTPTPQGMTLLWDSNVSLKTGKKYTVTDTYGDQKPNGKGIFMAASGDPRVHVEPDGTFYLEADGGHGRVYIKAINFNAMMEGECCFMDKAIRNTTWRLRSRHNENDANKFGGFGATCEMEEQLAEFSTEPYHNVHEHSVKKPLEKPLEVGKWFKYRYYVCNTPDNKGVQQKTEYDYNDGRGFVTVLEAVHESPKDYYMDEATFMKESYAWLRINNEETGKIAYKNVKIWKITKI